MNKKFEEYDAMEEECCGNCVYHYIQKPFCDWGEGAGENTNLDALPCEHYKRRPLRSKLKMYILIKDWVDIGHAVNTAFHAGAMIDDRGWSREDPVMKEWRENSFRKVSCKVKEKEFEKAKEYGDYFVVTEMMFDDAEVALVFKPREEWPRFFSFLKLYK